LEKLQEEKLDSASSKGSADCNEMQWASSEDSDGFLFHKMYVCSIVFHKAKTGVTNDMALPLNVFQRWHSPAYAESSFLLPIPRGVK